MQKRYQIPRFHDIALVVLTYGPLQITARQLTTILLGGLIGINLWPLLSFFALLPAALVLPFGWASPAGRPLEVWLLILLRYWLQPRVYLWHLPAQPQKKKKEKHSTQ
jgi:hypothetical protein